ncbi:hypothetical protein [Dyadobacter diqingensis]|uniref:hypothetical protein n=1 Tax=Dyadobacter diqingensis TaxID=2938121 RepID=UPI0020C564B8|nr:hypothetical protein [Dyadobacter diqingensis]
MFSDQNGPGAAAGSDTLETWRKHENSCDMQIDVINEAQRRLLTDRMRPGRKSTKTENAAFSGSHISFSQRKKYG